MHVPLKSASVIPAYPNDVALAHSKPSRPANLYMPTCRATRSYTMIRVLDVIVSLILVFAIGYVCLEW